MNVEPLESTFITSLTTAPQGNSSCALSDSPYFSRKKTGSNLNLKLIQIPIQFNSITKATRTRGEEKCQKSNSPIVQTNVSKLLPRKSIMLSIRNRSKSSATYLNY